MKETIALWKTTIPMLREERLSLQKKEGLLVTKFRLFKIGKVILRTLKDNAVEEKIEREKKQYKDQMWNKVNKWLVDLDSKDSQNP